MRTYHRAILSRNKQRVPHYSYCSALASCVMKQTWPAAKTTAPTSTATINTSTKYYSSLPALKNVKNDAEKSAMMNKSQSLFQQVFGIERATKQTGMDEPFPGLKIPDQPVYAKEKPKTQMTELTNGAIIASENTPGATMAVGLYLESGSKYEQPFMSGSSHMLERMAFKATTNRTNFRITKEAEVMSASLLASASREQMSYTVDCLKTHLPEAVELLLDASLNPKLANHEVAKMAKDLKKEIEELKQNPQAMLMEAVHSTAYDGGLGNALLASEGSLDSINGDALREFIAENYVAPRMVLAASGADHAELVSIASPMLETVAKGSEAAGKEIPSRYMGGDFRAKNESPLTSLILGFEFKGGWRDAKRSTAVTVLSMLLGGGGSFSAGGPGKGMYSRLYTRVLNRYGWAQNCTAFHSIFNDTGIVGISAMTDGQHVNDMISVMANELSAVADAKQITDEEFERAKNATVSSILMNLESKAVIAEDIGRQILTYNHRKMPHEFIAEVNSLTKQDLAAVAKDMLKSNPTLCMSGDVAGAPRFEAVKAMF
jgi:mitochondrial-processing peptidase subunit alpha